MARCDLLEMVARRKSKGDANWAAFLFSHIEGTDATKVQGGIPRILTKGKRKGSRTWDKEKRTPVVIVTEQECEMEAKAYEGLTGKCSECMGTGQVFVGWHHIEGTRYHPCEKCKATGLVQ